ncbi:MAG: hypothetical protein AB7F59_11845 [Bdellovibrionales bacterium]
MSQPKRPKAKETIQRPSRGPKEEMQQFRRCHSCEEVLAHSEEHQNCQRCGKFIAPFFYFDDHKLHFSDTGVRPYYVIPPNSYGPLIGLSARWSTEAQEP